MKIEQHDTPTEPQERMLNNNKYNYHYVAAGVGLVFVTVRVRFGVVVGELPSYKKYMQFVICSKPVPWFPRNTNTALW